MTENKPTETPFTLEQRQRTKAMDAARAVLSVKGFAAHSLPDHVRPADLADVATFILTGAHPHDRIPDETSSGEVSDGHHTHNELYEYRMLYNAHAALGWLAAGVPVVKSWRHADGEDCFGGGWFIVTATLPAGQVSNHYAAEHWDLFAVPEVDLPPEWDGHTPADAADRLRAHLAQED